MKIDQITIFANGNYPTHPIPLKILENSKKIICTDGAVNSIIDKDFQPNYIIGDLDSINKVCKEKYKDILIKIINQNMNDLQKAIIWAENKGAKVAKIIGAAGKREDHMIANIFTLLQFSTKLKIELYTDYGKFSVLHKKQTFNSHPGQQVSLFATDQTIKITSNGLKYRLNKDRLITLFNGALNESISDIFSINLSHGKILIYQLYK